MHWLFWLALILLVLVAKDWESEEDEQRARRQREAKKERWKAEIARAQASAQAIAQAAPKPTPYSRSHISARLRSDVLRRDKRTCQHCGAQAPNVAVHVDHKVPASKGGATTLSNLQVLCAECNLGKGNRFTG